MTARNLSWAAALLVVTLSWASLSVAILHSSASGAGFFGEVLGMSAPLLAVTAIAAFVSVFVLRRRHAFMAVWTLLLFLALVVLSLGGMKAASVGT